LLGKATHEGAKLVMADKLSAEAAALKATENYPENFAKPTEWRTKAVAQGVIKGLGERFAAMTPWMHNGKPMVECALEGELPIPNGVQLRQALEGASIGLVKYLAILDAIVDMDGEPMVWERKTTSQIRVGEAGIVFPDPDKVEMAKPNLQLSMELWLASKFLGRPVRHAIYEIVGIGRPIKSNPNVRIGTDYSLVDYSDAEIEEGLSQVGDVLLDWAQHQQSQVFPLNDGNCFSYNSRCQFHEICRTCPTQRENVVAVYPKVDENEREKRHATLEILNTDDEV
jgi:hypothetical protein